MKEKCDNCGYFYSFTDSPNKIEGYFITQEFHEARKSDLWDTIEKEKGNEKTYCYRCPECGFVKQKNSILRFLTGGSIDAFPSKEKQGFTISINPEQEEL